MKRSVMFVIGVLSIILLVATACSVASSPGNETESVATAGGPQVETAQPTTTAEPVETLEAADPAEGAPAAAEPEEPAPESSVPGPVTFSIVADESEARFIIDEVLNGNPKTVVGVTNAVEGEIMADYSNPQEAAVGAIRVDLSTLVTDNNFRNRAIHDAILQTGRPEYRFAEFRASELSGLPGSVELGVPFDFQITGELTIHGVTRQVTFDATVTPVSETRLEGVASLTIPYAEFDVRILRLPPQVASVADEVTLEIEFVASATP